jgi:hypothetical protein
MKVLGKVLLLHILLLVFTANGLLAASNVSFGKVFVSVHGQPQPEFSVGSPSYDFGCGIKPTTFLTIEANTHGDHLKQVGFKTKKETEGLSFENKTLVYLTCLYHDHNIWLSGFYFLISPFHDFW